MILLAFVNCPPVLTFPDSIASIFIGVSVALRVAILGFVGTVVLLASFATGSSAGTVSSLAKFESGTSVAAPSSLTKLESGTSVAAPSSLTKFESGASVAASRKRNN